MKKTISKVLVFVLLLQMTLTILLADASVSAKEFKGGADNVNKFDVSYNRLQYHCWWVTRTTITFRSQYGSMWWHLDEGDKLGTATIRAYYLEPKISLGGRYYAMAGCQVSMDPCDVSGDVTGMSQLADFRIKTKNADSRVCSPTVDMLEIQYTETKQKTNSFTAGTGLKYNNAKRFWEVSSDFDFANVSGSSSSYTYNIKNVSLTQKNKNGDHASWRYDYISKNNNYTWNAYLMSSSKVAGQVVYDIGCYPSESNRKYNIPTEIYYDIRFGAGDYSGEVADRLGPSTNRDMSILKGRIPLSY